MRWSTKIILDVDFSDAGHGHDVIIDGFGAPEPHHTWSVGRRSRLRLPPLRAGYAYSLYLRVQPWVHSPEVVAQTIVLGLDDRLLATVVLTDDQALAFDLPAVAALEGGHVLTIDHLDSVRSAAIDRYADGQSMGLMMRSLRLIRRRRGRTVAPGMLAPIGGTIADGTLVAGLEQRAGCGVREVLEHFECLGRWCGLAFLQESFGANHVSLLRYAGLSVAELAEGLFRRFEGVGRPGCVSAYHPPERPELWDLYENQFQVWWHVSPLARHTTQARIEAVEHIRLPFLQRKLAETMALAHKVFVLPTAETTAEVLAVYNALDVRGPNVLLCVVQSGEMPVGSVWWVRAGVMCGRVDRTPDERCGTNDVWLSVLGNAYVLAKSVG